MKKNEWQFSESKRKILKVHQILAVSFEIKNDMPFQKGHATQLTRNIKIKISYNNKKL